MFSLEGEYFPMRSAFYLLSPRTDKLSFPDMRPPVLSHRLPRGTIRRPLGINPGHRDAPLTRRYRDADTVEASA